MRLRVLACVLATSILAGMGCDFTPAIDIETPTYAPAVVIRTVLRVGQGAYVRLSTTGDPYAELPADAARLPSAMPVGATVTLLRNGVPVETLTPRSQTCYVAYRSECNAATGRTDTQSSGAYECGAYGGTVAIEAGATYTVRAEIPGLPIAEATVAVPVPVQVVASEASSGDPQMRRLRIRVPDAPGSGTRFGLTLYRDFGSYTTSVCRVGGPRDSTIVLSSPWRYQTRFTTTDPVLLADARGPTSSLPFATFTDATFSGGEAVLTIGTDVVGTTTSVVPTGRLTAEVAVLSPTLYDAYQTATVLFGDENPFAEPADLPGNVVGGYGLAGAVAITASSVEAP